jgi:hypothetical protein
MEVPRPGKTSDASGIFGVLRAKNIDDPPSWVMELLDTLCPLFRPEKFSLGSQSE